MGRDVGKGCEAAPQARTETEGRMKARGHEATGYGSGRSLVMLCGGERWEWRDRPHLSRDPASLVEPSQVLSGERYESEQC